MVMERLAVIQLWLGKILKKLYDNLLVILRMNYSLNYKHLKNKGIKNRIIW